jgi:hypothetical protein
VNTTQREPTNNEKAKDAKQGGEKLRIQKPYSARRFMKLV